MDDEMKELNRIWDSLESHLASMDGDQERSFEITDKDGKILGSVNIPVNADEDQIIEILNDETELLNPEISYFTGQDGEEDQININRDNGDDPSTTEYELKTSDEIEDFDEFMDNILDIERTQYLSGGKWITKEYTIVTGTGGPHTEFTTGYSINVYWGGKSREFTTYNDSARATIDRIEEYLNDCYPEE